MRAFISLYKKPQVSVILCKASRSFVTTYSRAMSTSEFPPKAVRAVALEIASLLKERKESVSVAETVCHP
jgi:hypothetical protein